MANVEQALRMALDAHLGQVDKQGKPYILHPLRVMARLGPGATEEEQIVAILHDVVEDTQVTWNDLESAGFSVEVLDTIGSLTHRASETYEEYIEGIFSDPVARRVKLADLQDSLDPARLLVSDQKDLDRIVKYKKAYDLLRKVEHGR